MNDPMTELGIKLHGDWTSQKVPAGVLFSERKVVLVEDRSRQRAEWAEVLRHHHIPFEYVAPQTQAAPAEAGV